MTQLKKSVAFTKHDIGTLHSYREALRRASDGLRAIDEDSEELFEVLDKMDAKFIESNHVKDRIAQLNEKYFALIEEAKSLANTIGRAKNIIERGSPYETSGTIVQPQVGTGPVSAGKSEEPQDRKSSSSNSEAG